MNPRNQPRRRRGGMRFRPAKTSRADNREAQKAREALIKEEPDSEAVFDQARVKQEIDRAENVAAGLPPDAQPEDHSQEDARKGGTRSRPGAVGQHQPPPPAVNTDNYQPVPLAEPPAKGLVGNLRAAAKNVMRKVDRLIRPRRNSNKEVIINCESLESRVAVMEHGVLEEFTIERNTEERLVGSIFKGKVRNLEDGLKAAFVDIGFEKNAFLHYWDIIPSSFDSSVEIVERKSRNKRDKPRITHKDIPRLYPPGTEIIIQVTKGPIGTKGPRVTTNLVLPGRFLVLLPHSDQSGISRKIEDPEERQRLKHILRELTIPDGMGVIMRTAGEGQKLRYFVRDLAMLLEEWKEIQERIRKQPLATCVFREPDLVERTVRDFLTEDVERIVVDSKEAYERIQAIINKISRRSTEKVRLYNEHQPIFDRFNISRQLELAFSRQVSLKSGGYIVIDETEALSAIDVNTGRHKSGPKDQEGTILKVNIEAAGEICRQLRLRNMGGLIVLDFIDMKSRRDQQTIYQKMKEGLKRDKAKTHILPISQLGLMEMTRQRHTESVHSSVYDDCPYCNGRGKVKSVLSMSVEIQRKLSEILRKRERDESDFQLRILVHPTVLERLRTEDEQLIIDMEKKYFGKLSFRPDDSLHAEEFKIYNAINNRELARSN